MQRVLIVEDNEATLRSLTRWFRRHGVAVVSTTSGKRAVRLASSCDAVILDIGLPDTNGIEVCKVLRERAYTRPVLMLTGSRLQAQKRAAFRAGATDYIIKGTPNSELLWRLTAQVEQFDRSRLGPSSEETVTPIVLDRADQTVWVHGERVSLSDKECRILVLLIDGAPCFVTKAKLKAEGLRNPEATGHALEQRVSALRLKLGRDGWRIESVQRRGYRIDLGS